MAIIPQPDTPDYPLPTLPGVPAYLRPVLLLWLAPLLAWLETQLYQRVTARCSTHPLVQLAARYDLTPVVRQCASYYHTTGPGTCPTYSVDTLVRAEVVRLWAGSCSDPALERLLVSDLVARHFAGLPLLGPTPDHTTLHRFHAWLTQHAPAALFTGVLAFLDAVDPEDPATTPQIVDTFALAPAAAPQDVRTLLQHLGRQLLAAWRAAAPPTTPDPLGAVDLAPLTARLRRRTPDERTASLRAVVGCVQALHTALTPAVAALPPAAQADLRVLLARLSKVLADETTADATGQIVERPVGDKGSYRLGSAHDPAATFRKHGDDPAVFGYNAAVATTATRIRAAVVVTGSTPDSATPSAVLTAEAAAGQPLPAHLVMDRAGGWGKTRAEVRTTSAGATQMVAYIPPGGGTDPDRFGPSDFIVSADGTTCTCPNGVVSTTTVASGAGDGDYFRFTAKQCADCPLWGRCRPADGKPRSHRTVYVSPYSAHLAEAGRFNRTDLGQTLLGQRWRVEPTIAWLVRYDGARRARRVGQAAAQLHLYQACAWRNLCRWLARGAPQQGTAWGGVCP